MGGGEACACVTSLFLGVFMIVSCFLLWGVVYTMDGYYYYYYYNFGRTFLHKNDASSPPTTLTQGDTNPTHNLNNQTPPTLLRQTSSCMKLTQSNNLVKSQSPPLKGDSSLWAKTFVMYVCFLYKPVYQSIYIIIIIIILFAKSHYMLAATTTIFHSILPLFMCSWTNASVVVHANVSEEKGQHFNNMILGQ